MLLGLRTLVLTLLLAIFPREVLSQSNDQANLLFGKAVTTYQAAEVANGSEREELLRQVDALLRQIASEFPNSIPAQFMADRQQLGPINLDVVASATDQVAMLDRLRDGIYAISPDACKIGESSLGDVWGIYFKLIEKPQFSTGLEESCTIKKATEIEGHLSIDADCNLEGDVNEQVHLWQILSDKKFIDFANGQSTYYLCHENEHTDSTPEPSMGADVELAPGITVEGSNSRWANSIVHIGPPPNIHGCGAFPRYECLESLGYSESSSDFIVTSAEILPGPGVIPVGFIDAGKVDLVVTGELWSGTGAVLANGIPTIQVPAYPSADPTQYRGRVIRSLLQRFPSLIGHHRNVEGHRLLPNGSQRFTTTVWFTESCRTCDLVAYGVAEADYGPAGELRGVRVLGALDVTDLPQSSFWSPELLKKHPKLVQYALNIRGYTAGEMDGQFRQATREAIVSFQKDQGIRAVSGKLDDQTIAALADEATLLSQGATADRSVSSTVKRSEGPIRAARQSALARSSGVGSMARALEGQMYTAEELQAWQTLQEAGGAELMSTLMNEIFVAAKNEQWSKMIGSLYQINKDTAPSVILRIADQILVEFVGEAELEPLFTDNNLPAESELGDLFSIWALNRARALNQAVSIEYDELENAGFRKTQSWQAAYHAIGLDVGGVEKWVHNDGREYVFYLDREGRRGIVFDGINNGTFNYCDSPACHMIVDILPWIKWGATVHDATTAVQRAEVFKRSWLASRPSEKNALALAEF